MISVNGIGSNNIMFRSARTGRIAQKVINGKTLASTAGVGYTGCSSMWQWHECYATLLNECEVYGGPIVSSSFYDTGFKKTQLPLFTLNPELIMLKDSNGSVIWYWLKNVASGSAFCACRVGAASDGGASGSGGLRLEFLLSV